mgnify:FL=1|jgi:lipopolysaccharide export system protein LptC
MASDNFHTQLVGWSKIILPLCALALLSTLFLFARSNPDATNIPFADINTLAQEQKINAPRFSGVADDGSIIAITAGSAQLDPNNAQNLKISSLSLDVNAADGSEIRIEAVGGELDNDAKVAYLSGLARLETSTGYTMETNGLTANLQSGVISSEGALEIRAPFGALTAGRVTIKTTGDGKGQQMLFTDGVVLIYTPQASTAQDAKE